MQMANVEIGRRVVVLIVKYDIIPEIAKKRNVTWFAHVMRANETLANTILQGNVEREIARIRPTRQSLNERGSSAVKCRTRN